ncbi:hypothetical protein HDU79_001654 [Rhizoclosmatium sp. JEL0117]|nr:hypothetical protein HDU79_001654 [Rhizoclosmatium sp. JEL0117]
MKHILWKLIAVLFATASLQIGLPVAPAKNQSSVTIAIIGLYSELEYYTAADYSTFDYYMTPGWQIYDDLMIRHAVQLLNANSSILPNTTIKIKHFNFYDPQYAPDFYATESMGYAGLVALNLTQNPENSDIIAVIGGWGPKALQVESKIYAQYDIPYCGIIPSDAFLDDKNNYKTLFRTIWSQTGFELHLLAFLRKINVTRIGIVAYGDNPFVQAIENALTANGLDVATLIFVRRLRDVPSTISILEKKDIRYVYMDLGSAYFAGYFYFSASARGLVGPGYIWMGMDFPYFPEQYTTFPNRSLDVEAMGFIYMAGSSWFTWADPSTSVFVGLNTSLGLNWPVVPEIPIQNMNYSIPTDQFQFFGINGYMEGAYDCVMTLATGFDKLLQEDKSLTPEKLSKRQLQDKLNLKLWQRTGFQGIGYAPLVYNDNGDWELPFYWATIGPEYNMYVSVITYPNYSVALFPDSTYFNGNMTTWPPDGSVVKTKIALIEELSIQARIIYALEAFGFALGVFCVVTQVILSSRGSKDSNLHFTIVIILGAFLCYGSLTSFIGTPTTRLCVLRVWLPITGLPLMLLAITIKNARIYFVFSSKTVISKWKLSSELAIFVILLGILMFQFILISWNSQNRPSAHLYALSRTVLATVCTDSNDGVNLVTAVASLTAAVILILVLLAYKTHNISQKYNESIQILFVGVLIVSLAGIFLPNVFVSTPSNLQLFSAVLFVWVTTTGVLCIYLVPKLLVQTLEKSELQKALWKGRRRLNEQLSQTKHKPAQRTSKGQSQINSGVGSFLSKGQASTIASLSRATVSLQPVKFKGYAFYRIYSAGSKSSWKAMALSLCKYRTEFVGLILTSAETFQSISIESIMSLDTITVGGHFLVISTNLKSGLYSAKQQTIVEFEHSDDLELTHQTISEQLKKAGV